MFTYLMRSNVRFCACVCIVVCSCMLCVLLFVHACCVCYCLFMHVVCVHCCVFMHVVCVIVCSCMLCVDMCVFMHVVCFFFHFHLGVFFHFQLGLSPDLRRFNNGPVCIMFCYIYDTRGSVVKCVNACVHACCVSFVQNDYTKLLFCSMLTN